MNNKQRKQIIDELTKEGYSILDSNPKRRGGNGEVWFVKNNNIELALKIIEFKGNNSKKDRACREIKTLTNIKSKGGIRGVISIGSSKILKNYA